MSSLPRGKVRLFNHAKPALKAGTYDVTMTQAITEGASTVIGAAPKGFVLEVTGPRLRLPPTDVIAVSPPPDEREANTQTLPHVTLRQRTLPWMRTPDGFEGDNGHPVPWMGLMVFRKDEITLDEGGTARDLTFGDTSKLANAYPGLDADEPCVWVGVRESRLRKFLPKRSSELPYLTHVRQVSTADQEGKDDDDGFVAMCISNRMPKAPGTDYVAVLVSFEGWLRDEDFWALAGTPPTTRPSTGGIRGVTHLADIARAFTTHGSAAARTFVSRGAGITIADGGLPPTTMDRGAISRVASDATLSLDRTPPRRHVDVVDVRLDRVDIDPSRFDWITALTDPTFRLPVLHHWQFRTADAPNDFETLAKALGFRQAKPNANPPVRKGVEMMGRDVADLSTGHFRLDHRSRGGHAGTSLYRGPLVAAPVSIAPGVEEEGTPAIGTLAVHSKQLLQKTVSMVDVRVGTALRKKARLELNTTYAAAFEVGRMLALSQRHVLQLLADYRRLYRTRRRTFALANDFQVVDQTRLKLDFVEHRFGLLDQLGLLEKFLEPLGGCMDPAPFRDTLTDPLGLDPFTGHTEVPGMHFESLAAVLGLTEAGMRETMPSLTRTLDAGAATGWIGPGQVVDRRDIGGIIDAMDTFNTSELEANLPHLLDALMRDPSRGDLP